MNARSVLRLSLLVFAVGAAVCLPFLIFGEEVFVPLLDSLKGRTGWLVLGTILLLSLDAVLPVPSAWVLIFLALQAGMVTGIVAGSLGLCLGVLVSTWVGRVTVGRLAPWLIPDAEIARLRHSMARHTTLTLACMRGVPVLAETSVMIAAAAGVPAWRIFAVTVPPNLAIAVVYAVAANDSFLTACIAFLATIAVSGLTWRVAAAIGTARATPSRQA